jgi:hypothetical protein
MGSLPRLRSEGVDRLHVLKASRAEPTARPISSGDETGASAKASPVLGSMSGTVPPLEAAGSPWMKF